jgi:hypothetical protein
MNSKRARSNAKADIWDINVKRKDFIKFVLSIKISKTIVSQDNDDQHDYNAEEMSKIISNYNSKRRNAIPNIWSIQEE